MANIFGVNIETPQEQQQRQLAEMLAGQRSIKNAHERFGFNLANALSASFGGLKKQRKTKEEQFDAIAEGQAAADEQFAASNLAKQEAERNAVQVFEAHIANGSDEATAQQAAQAVLANTAGNEQQIRESITVENINQRKAQAIAGGADPLAARQLAMAETAARLRELGGAENVQLANQISSAMVAEQVATRTRKLEEAKLKADTAKAEATAAKDRALATKASSTDLERLQLDREEAYGRLSTATTPEAQERAQREIEEFNGATQLRQRRY
jgi:hypothetical protein